MGFRRSTHLLSFHTHYPRFLLQPVILVASACMCLCGRSALEAVLEAGMTSVTRMTAKSFAVFRTFKMEINFMIL